MGSGMEGMDEGSERERKERTGQEQREFDRLRTASNNAANVPGTFDLTDADTFKVTS